MNRIPFFSRYFLLPLGILLLCGCGDARRQSIEGAATFDGRPIDNGYIKFIPQDGTRGPAAGANIENGKFAVAAEVGPFAGTFRVEITAMRAGSRKAFDPESNRTVAVMEQYIPAKYNAESELTATIDAKSTSPLEFALRSK
ncbi:MAG: hypothetical protein IT426_12315 [Pirellulales bacterium]|nr:hypothetical protein [Pirellulales bacterium]